MVNYKLQKNTNEKSPFCGQVFARAVVTDEIDLDGLAERIQRNCTAKKSDVKAVLTEMVEVMAEELQASHKVRINGLGSFKMSLRGSYATSPKVFTPSHNIKSMRVLFTPEYTKDANGNRQAVLISGAKVQELTEYTKEE